MKIRERIRVRYAETDRMKAVYYSNYFVWFEVGRTALFNSIGIPYKKLEEDMDCILPVVEAYCKYRRSAYFDDEIYVETKISDIKRRSITFSYTILKEDKTLAEGYTKHIAINSKGKIISFPQGVYQALLKAKDENN